MIAMGWKVRVLGIAFAVGCSSNPSSIAPTDSGPSDVQAIGSPSDGGSGCYTQSGSASTEECTFSSCAVSGSSCAALPGSTFGSCPSSGLYGCCVETRSPISGKHRPIADGCSDALNQRRRTGGAHSCLAAGNQSSIYVGLLFGIGREAWCRQTGRSGS